MLEKSVFSSYMKQLISSSIFKSMSKSEIITTLESKSAEIVNYKKNELICKQYEPLDYIGIILEGKVHMTRQCVNTSTMSTYVMGKNDVFGLDIICSDATTSPYAIEVEQSSTVLYIESSKLFFMDKANYKFTSKFNLNLIKVLAEHSVFMTKQMDYIRIMSLKKRICTFLLDNYMINKNKLFIINMTRDQMANYLNATRPAVSRILRELKEQNIIDYYRSSFKILDLETLSNL